MRKRTLAGIIGTTLLAGALTVGGCAANGVSDEVSRSFTIAMTGLGLPSEFQSEVNNPVEYATNMLLQGHLDKAVDNYLLAKTAGSEWLKDFNSTESFFTQRSTDNSWLRDFYGNRLFLRPNPRDENYGTLENEIISAVWQNYDFNAPHPTKPKIIEQVESILDVTDEVTEDIAYFSHREIGAYYLNDAQDYDAARDHFLKAMRVRNTPEIHQLLRLTNQKKKVTQEKAQITDEELQEYVNAPIEPPKLDSIGVRFFPQEYPVLPLEETMACKSGTFSGWGMLHVGGMRRFDREVGQVSGGRTWGVPIYNYGLLLENRFTYTPPSEETKPDYKDELFEVKLYPQATSEIQGFVARWHMLKN